MLHVTFQCDGNHTRFRIGHVQACRLQFTPWILDPTKCSTVTCIRLPIGLCPAASPCGFSVPALVINDLPALMTDDRCPLFRPDQTAAPQTRNSRQRPGGHATPLARPGSARAWARPPGRCRKFRVCISAGAGVFQGQRSCSRCPVPLILLHFTQRWSHSHRPARRVAKRRTAARSDRVHVRSSGQPWVTNGQMK